MGTTYVYISLGFKRLKQTYIFLITRLMNTSTLVQRSECFFQAAKHSETIPLFSEMHLEADEPGSNIAVGWRC